MLVSAEMPKFVCWIRLSFPKSYQRDYIDDILDTIKGIEAQKSHTIPKNSTLDFVGCPAGTFDHLIRLRRYE